MSGLPITNDPGWTHEQPGYALDAAAVQRDEQRKRMVAWGMRIVNCGLCVMMAATGVLSLGEATFSLKPSHISEFFVALYVLLFAAVWFLFEISQIRPIAAVHDLLRRNFGFLFSPI